MKLLWWLLSLAFMAGEFYLSSQSGDRVGIPAPWDKLTHFAGYAVLGFLLAKASGSWRSALLLAAWFGASDELHQAFVPGRAAGLDDWLADALGAWLGARIGTRRQRAAKWDQGPGAAR